MSINLLPPKYQPRPTWVWSSFLRVLGIGLLIYVIGFSSMFYYLHRSSLDGQIANLNRNIDNLQPTFEKIVDYEDALTKVREIEVVAERIGKAKEIWSDILTGLAGSLEDNIWFVRIIKTEDLVIIEGEAKDFAAVADLTLGFRKLPWFGQVDVVETNKIVQNRSNSAEDSLVERNISADEYRQNRTFDFEERITLSEEVRFRIEAKLKAGISLLTSTEGGAK